MGYTHYYYRHEIEHNKELWDKFLADVKKVASKFQLIIVNSVDFATDSGGKQLKSTGKIKIEIGGGMGEGEPPKFTKDTIWFNGVGDDSHETLNIDRDYFPHLKEDGEYKKKQWREEKKIFECTKTAYKPYDLLVTATLTLYKYHFKDKVSIASDGDEEGFLKGVELVNKTLGYTIAAENIIMDEDDDE